MTTPVDASRKSTSENLGFSLIVDKLRIGQTTYMHRGRGKGGGQKGGGGAEGRGLDVIFCLDFN